MAYAEERSGFFPQYRQDVRQFMTGVNELKRRVGMSLGIRLRQRGGKDVVAGAMKD